MTLSPTVAETKASPTSVTGAVLTRMTTLIKRQNYARY
jgi:hypothetical protein